MNSFNIYRIFRKAVENDKRRKLKQKGWGKIIKSKFVQNSELKGSGWVLIGGFINSEVTLALLDAEK